jgi:hypothetical protein
MEGTIAALRHRFKLHLPLARVFVVLIVLGLPSFAAALSFPRQTPAHT